MTLLLSCSIVKRNEYIAVLAKWVPLCSTTQTQLGRAGIGGVGVT